MLQVDLAAHDFLPAGEAFQLIRATLEARRPRGLIRRDFPVLMWVQNGAARLHLDGNRMDLGEGDVVFLRARDSHALQARAEETLAVLLVFDPALIDSLAERHAALGARFFWSTDPGPARLYRDSQQLIDLNRGALRLEHGRRDALEAEAFLLPLLASLLDGTGRVPADAPDWLARACAAAEDPRIFREGAAGFARVAGRAHPHVSRTARKYLGKTPSEIINEQRMIYAAKRLAGSPDTLAEVASDCGIPNLSHFHKLFRQHHGITPQRYRKAHQKGLLQPQ